MSTAVKRDEKGRFAATVRGQNKRLHVRFTDETFRKVNNLAAENNSSVAGQVEKLVEKALSPKFSAVGFLAGSAIGSVIGTLLTRFWIG